MILQTFPKTEYDLSFPTDIYRGALELLVQKFNNINGLTVPRSANLEGLNWDSSDWRNHITMPSLNFSGASLIGANFRGCWLENANFEDCNLRNADFTGANCGGASFAGAYIKDMKPPAIITGCNFTGCKGRLYVPEYLSQRFPL